MTTNSPFESNAVKDREKVKREQKESDLWCGKNQKDVSRQMGVESHEDGGFLNCWGNLLFALPHTTLPGIKFQWVFRFYSFLLLGRFRFDFAFIN
jgi:hypothetical protein